MARKQYAFNKLAGCIRQFRSRATRTLVGHYQGEQAGLGRDSDFPWVCLCEKHHTFMCVETLSALTSIRDPREFCKECRDDVVVHCNCCDKDYNPKEWRTLSLLGVQEFPEDFSYELRNCSCNSTLAKKLALHHG